MGVTLYLRNTVRLVGLLAIVMGVVLLGYHGWSALHEDPTLAYSLKHPAHVPHWLSHASPVLQGRLGWLCILLVEMPLTLLLLVGGTLATRVGSPALSAPLSYLGRTVSRRAQAGRQFINDLSARALHSSAPAVQSAAVLLGRSRYAMRYLLYR